MSDNWVIMYWTFGTVAPPFVALERANARSLWLPHDDSPCTSASWPQTQQQTSTEEPKHSCINEANWFHSLSIGTCCSTAPLRTSFWIVTFTLIRFEWGSVQTNAASTRRTWQHSEVHQVQKTYLDILENLCSTSFVMPLIRLRHIARSSLDSSAATTHAAGGCKYLQH